MGDFDIDTSEKSASSNRMGKQYYLNMLASHGAEMLINKATRVTSTTATVIDRILTNVTQYSITPGVIPYDLTDHYPIFVKACNSCNNSRTRPVVKTYRTFKHFNLESFTEDLHSKLYYFFENLEVNAENLNAALDQFYPLITETINHHAPLRKLSRKQKRLSLKPQITKGLLISIKNKQKMYKTHHLNCTKAQKYLYKLYANKLTKIKDLAHKYYYHDQLQINKNNSKGTWDVLRSLLPSKIKQAGPHTLKTNQNDGSNITDAFEIAQEINSYFTNIGKSWARKLNSSDNQFLSCLGKSTPPSIFLVPTTPFEIALMINSLKSKKAAGVDDISPYFLQLSSNILAPSLLFIVNRCLSLWVFPQKLKIAKVIPIHKSGTTDKIEKYRPIFLLTSLSKILRSFC